MAESSEDDLWGQLDDADDQRRGELLLELAERAYQRRDLGQFTTLVEAAAQAAARAGDDRLTAYAEFNQGQGLLELHRPAEAVPHFITAAGHFHRIGEQSDTALCHQRAGHACWEASDEDAALEHWGTALVLFAAEDDQLSVGRVHMMVGELHMRTGHHDAAVTAFTAARSAFRSAGAAHHVAWADDTAAAALLRLGRTAEAIPLLRSCVDVARAGDDGSARGYAALRLGVGLRVVGNPQDALEYLDDARSHYTETDNVMGTAKCDLEAGHALAALGEHEHALEVYRVARSLFDAVGADRYLALVEAASAHEYERLDRPADALEAAAAAVRHAEAAGSATVLTEAAMRLCAAQLTADDPTAAYATLQHFDLEPAASSPAETAESVEQHRVAAAVLLALGRSSEAHDLVASALATAPAQTPLDVIASLHELLWRTRTELGQRADGDLAHAVALFLVVGDAVRATALSRHLLPDPTIGTVRHSDVMALRHLPGPGSDGTPWTPTDDDDD